MKVLLIGANGYLGPHVVKALEQHHELRVTDIRPPAEKSRHEYVRLDVTSLDQVRAAAKGMDAIVNLSVLRPDRKLAFDVNTRGCYNMMLAAVEYGIKRVINTGPHLVVSGPPTDGFDFGITPRFASAAGNAPVWFEQIARAGNLPHFHAPPRHLRARVSLLFIP